MNIFKKVKAFFKEKPLQCIPSEEVTSMMHLRELLRKGIAVKVDGYTFTDPERLLHWYTIEENKSPEAIRMIDYSWGLLDDIY